MIFKVKCTQALPLILKGKVGNVKTFGGVSPELDSTCLYVVSIIPDWIPFKSTDDQILIQFLLPVNSS